MKRLDHNVDANGEGISGGTGPGLRGGYTTPVNQRGQW